MRCAVCADLRVLCLLQTAGTTWLHPLHGPRRSSAWALIRYHGPSMTSGQSLRSRNLIISAGMHAGTTGGPAAGTIHAVAVIVLAFHPVRMMMSGRSPARPDPLCPEEPGWLAERLARVSLVPLSAPPPARFVRELSPVIPWPSVAQPVKVVRMITPLPLVKEGERSLRNRYRTIRHRGGQGGKPRSGTKRSACLGFKYRVLQATLSRENTE